MAKKSTSSKWIVRCDGLKVAKCASQKKADKMSFDLQQKTPNGMTMIFTVEPEPAPAN